MEKQIIFKHSTALALQTTLPLWSDSYAESKDYFLSLKNSKCFECIYQSGITYALFYGIIDSAIAP